MAGGLAHTFARLRALNMLTALKRTNCDDRRRGAGDGDRPDPSLAHGEAVVWGRTDNHALMIFGGGFIVRDGHAVDYWIKDSFAPYVYRRFTRR